MPDSDIISRAETLLRRRYDLDAAEAHALLFKVAEQQHKSLQSVALSVIDRSRSGLRQVT